MYYPYAYVYVHTYVYVYVYVYIYMYTYTYTYMYLAHRVKWDNYTSPHDLNKERKERGNEGKEKHIFRRRDEIAETYLGCIIKLN